MKDKKLAKIILTLILILLFLNTVADKYHWYYTIWWFDILMHTLGGYFVALSIISIFPIQNLSRVSVLKVILGVFLVGSGWEFFELFFTNYVSKYPFSMSDTLADLFFDLLGGSSAIFYYFKFYKTKILK